MSSRFVLAMSESSAVREPVADGDESKSGDSSVATGKTKKSAAEKKAEKNAAKEARQAAAAQLAAAKAEGVSVVDLGGLDAADGTFGALVLVQSAFADDRRWTDIAELAAREVESSETVALNGVWIRARVHTVRGKGKFAFIVLRRGYSSIQCVVSDGAGGMTKAAVKWAAKLTDETVVDVFGDVVPVDSQISGTSIKRSELHVRKLFAVSVAASGLPFQLDDAAKPWKPLANEESAAPQQENQQAETAAGMTVDSTGAVITVGQDIRLDHRWIDLRVPAHHAIFRLQSRVGQYFREFLYSEGFMEIHTPKLTPGVSEGGAAVFRLKYFDREACLAQSPQLYKQMAINADFNRVFEIGPVFRAEDSKTHRHMCEFVGLDMEMEIKQHYHEILKVLGDCFVFIFDQIKAKCAVELDAVHRQYPFEWIKYRRETLVIPFPDAVKMLREANVDIGDYDDLSTPQERTLGKLVKAKFDVDFYIVDRYPLSARPFYTMPAADDPNYTNSYDVFLRGEEITSGAQRVHDVPLLKKRAEACGIPLSNIESYLDSFSAGAYPHGGAGIGLERVVMLMLGLDNIRKTSMFPRTPARLTP